MRLKDLNRYVYPRAKNADYDHLREVFSPYQSGRVEEFEHVYPRGKAAECDDLHDTWSSSEFKMFLEPYLASEDLQNWLRTSE